MSLTNKVIRLPGGPRLVNRNPAARGAQTKRLSQPQFLAPACDCPAFTCPLCHGVWARGEIQVYFALGNCGADCPVCHRPMAYDVQHRAASCPHWVEKEGR